MANPSGSVAEGSPARDGAQRSERKKGGDPAPGDSKGHSPWRAFGDFPRDGKVTRVQGGAPAIGGCWDYQSRKSPRGAKHGKAMLSRSARSGECRGGTAPSHRQAGAAGRSACSILPFCLGYTEKRTNFFYLPQKHFAGTRRLYAIQGKFKKRWKRRRFRAIMRTEFCRPAAFCTGRRR